MVKQNMIANNSLYNNNWYRETITAAPYTTKGSLDGIYMLRAKLTINFHYMWTDYLSNFTIIKKENKKYNPTTSQ